MSAHRALQLAVLQILDTSAIHPYYWSIQGMGMLRLYIRNLGRLHIWDSRLRYPGVSMVHNHSWDLKSTVVAGRIVNTKYIPGPLGNAWHQRRLVTGYDCHFVEQDTVVSLHQGVDEVYLPGEEYVQQAHEIHRTDAEDVTITLMERREDVQGQADVFWRVGQTWGTAQPREATKEEIHRTCVRAIASLEWELQ